MLANLLLYGLILKRWQGDIGLPGPRGPDGVPGKGVSGEKVTDIFHNLCV